MIGNKVQILKNFPSTNDFLKQQNKSDLVDGEVVCARSQENGRGQRGNTWETEPNKNLTFSFYLEPLDLNVNQQFSLNYFVSVGILECLKQLVDKPENILLKWPNDIYYGDKKIGGILIENNVKESKISHTIIGIGININQEQFNLRTATSLYIETRKEFSVEEVLAKMIHSLDISYNLFVKDFMLLKKEYLNHLLGYQKTRKYFNNLQDCFFDGEIVEVGDHGLVKIRSGELLLEFGLKEISFVFD